jgi:8-oxo-dGTP pyrophosphatase MutT (NUDIX family)
MYIMNNNSCVIIYYKNLENNVSILIGDESKWVSDDYDIDKLVNFKDFEKLPNIYTTYKDLHKECKQRVDFLQKYIKEKIKYDTPEYIQVENIFKIHFRYLKPQYKTGFIKGGRKTNETTLETIKREIKEEIGMLENFSHNFLTYIIDKEFNYSSKNNNIKEATIVSYFKLEVSNDIKKGIENKIINRNNQSYGELFNVRFIEIKELLKLKNLNRQTEYGITELMKLI